MRLSLIIRAACNSSLANIFANWSSIGLFPSLQSLDGYPSILKVRIPDGCNWRLSGESLGITILNLLILFQIYTSFLILNTVYSSQTPLCGVERSGMEQKGV